MIGSVDELLQAYSSTPLNVQEAETYIKRTLNSIKIKMLTIVFIYAPFLLWAIYSILVSGDSSLLSRFVRILVVSTLISIFPLLTIIALFRDFRKEKQKLQGARVYRSLVFMEDITTDYVGNNIYHFRRNLQEKNERRKIASEDENYIEKGITSHS